MAEPDLNQKTGKTMATVAWLAGFVVLFLFFDDLIQDKINPNQAPESVFNQGAIEVKLKRNASGHYVSNGLINETPVTFLLDTGATQVSIPQTTADKIGLVYGQKQRVNTANGAIDVYRTQVDVLQIGDIKLRNVAASINPFMEGEILLGMSALKKIEFSQRGDVLTLRKY